MGLGDHFKRTSRQELLDRLDNMQLEIDKLKSQIGVIWITKTTAGTPATGQSGTFVENTNDNTLHVYSHGGWRQIFP